MNVYIIHYTPNKSRKIHIDTNIVPEIKNLPRIRDIVYINEYDREADFIQDIKKKCSLKTGEISCSKKHFEAWQKFANTEDEYCMVLEDDVIVIDGIDVSINWSKIFTLINDKTHYISIGSGLNRHGETLGLTPQKYGRCTDSYIINRTFLNCFLDENGKVKENYDTAIGHYMNKVTINNDIKCYFYEPSIFKQGSHLHKKEFPTNIRAF